MREILWEITTCFKKLVALEYTIMYYVVTGEADTIKNPKFFPDEWAGGWQAAKNLWFLAGRMCRWLADSGKSAVMGSSQFCGAAAPRLNLKDALFPMLSKADAIRVIHNNAMAYKNNLTNKNLLFFTLCQGEYASLEVAFLPRNYLHLTGVQTSLRSTDFYNLALRDRIREQDIAFSGDGTTVMKLYILPSLMNIHINARMVGDYDDSKSFLVTDKLAGTTTAVMGFKKDGEYYIPNTALKYDIRDVVKRPVQRVIGIFIKERHEYTYCRYSYLAKEYKINDVIFLPELSTKVDRDHIVTQIT